MLCHGSDSLEMLKGTIEALAGIPVGLQRLVVLRGGEQAALQQGGTLRALGLGRGSKVQVHTDREAAQHSKRCAHRTVAHSPPP